MIIFKSKFFIIFILFFLLTGCSDNDLLSIHVIDVGQGDSILIQTPNGKNFLVDGADEDEANIVKSYLRKQNIRHLDFIIATHCDTDHIGGLDTIIKDFEVNKLFMPKEVNDNKAYNNLITSCSNSNIPIDHLCAYDSIKLMDNLTLDVLSPTYIQDESNLNSIVFTLTYHNKSFLFTGDCESENETEIINSFDLDNVDFLKVGHHGSSSSTSLDFLSATTPDIAAISCGYKNQYGHPHPSTLNNLNQNNILIYRTDLHGDLVFYSDGDIIFTKKDYELNKSR